MNKKTIITAIVACGFIAAISMPLIAGAGEHCSSGKDKCATRTQDNEKEHWKKHDLSEHSDKSPIVPIKRLPEGKTYGEWAAEWTKWAYSSPKSRNPLTDDTGAFCAENQPKGEVWFLAGALETTAAVVNRNCPIPPNKTLFYPIITQGWIDCPNTPDEDLTDAQVRNIVASLAGGDGASQVASTLDGVPVSSLGVSIVRTQSPRFTSVLPVDHIVGDPNCGFILPAGKTGRQITEGYWVMLSPLSAGTHTLTLQTNTTTPTTSDTLVTYNLTVLAKGHDHDHDHHE